MLKLKVASYNIHKGIGLDRRRNPGRVVDVLNEIDADIIALQEADRRFGSRAAVIPPKLLEQHSDYQPVLFPGEVDGSMGWHGNVILVRKSVNIITQEALHIPHLEPRGAAMAHVEMGDVQLAVYGMHLDISGLWRRRQARAIVEHAARFVAAQNDEAGAKEKNALPTIFMGDFNEWNGWGGSMPIFQRRYAKVHCGRSFHVRRPIAQLDHILHCPQLELRDCGVHDSALSRQTSDHFPIWAELDVG